MIKQYRLALICILLLGILLFIVSLYDIFSDQGWIQEILAVYGILIILVFILLLVNTRKPSAEKINKTVEEFEKTLKGRLHHFKCPKCTGIFAVKKSRQNNKKAFTLTCPDCGYVGRIPSKPTVVEAEIPEKKSVNINFKCSKCGESVSLWAEGTQLHSDIKIHTCPYCGEKQTMKNI
jgi:predicted RNA-binding Zn-ribbon protein involved in translation (DUF1610 family)